jgi:hypothetical protein
MTPLDLSAIERHIDAYAGFPGNALVADARAMVARIKALDAALREIADGLGLDRSELREIATAALSPKYSNVYCSQCGGDFGPGDHGFSHCDSHKGPTPPAQESERK